MKVLLILALVLLLIALLPLGVSLLYDQTGFFLSLKVAYFKIRLFPSKKEKPPKKEKKPKKSKPKQADGHPKNGGSLELAKSCLPLVKPALSGLRRRLTINHLELHVVWAAYDPADAALGYGCANAALGTIWPLFYQNFKIRDHSLTCDVDFDAQQPTLYARADLTMTVFQILTLALPLLFRFLKIYRAIHAAPKGETVKKEA